MSSFFFADKPKKELVASHITCFLKFSLYIVSALALNKLRSAEEELDSILNAVSRVEPWTAGCEAQTLLLCYADFEVPPFDSAFKEKITEVITFKEKITEVITFKEKITEVIFSTFLKQLILMNFTI